MAARRQAVTEIPETMTYNEVMAALKSSRSFIDQLVADGDLVAYRIGRRKKLIDKKSVLAFFQRPFNAPAVDHRESLNRCR